MDVDGETMAKKKIPVPDVARLVSAWALFTACVFLGSFALAYHHVACDLCVQPTDITGMVSCAASQAAAAALALLLPRRYLCVRHAAHALAYLALALAIVVHFVLMMAADHIVMIYWTIFFMAGDFASFLALLLGREED